jgi:hypothetical protein
MKTESPWGPRRGAVSLTFDDGDRSQLEKAIPAMDDRKLKGTFYLWPHGEQWKERLSPWQEVAARGHEIGNHTLSHTCSDNIIRKSGGLEEKTLEDLENDILAAQERLVQLAPHQEQWTVAYPCYCAFVGRGRSRASYAPLIAKHFLAGRGGGEYGIANHPGVTDLSCLWGLATERMSGFEMIGLVEELTFKGRWVVLVFHEINGSYLTVGNHDFCMLLDYLEREKDRIWTAPVVEVARKVAAFQSA